MMRHVEDLPRELKCGHGDNADLGEEYLNTSYRDGDREYVDGRIVERYVGEVDHAALQTRIAIYLANHYKNLWVVVEVRLQVKPHRFRVPDVTAVLGPPPRERLISKPPLIVIEVLSPADRVGEMEEKIQDYLDFGIPNIWVLNPRSRRAFVHTTDGVREVKDGVPRTVDGAIEVPLAELFEE